MSSYVFDDGGESTHPCADEYIELIKKSGPKCRKVKFDSGDFLVLEQHDRKRVITSLLEHEHGYKILDTLKIRIKNSLATPENKAELLAMINPPEPVVVQAAVVQPEPVVEAVPDKALPSEAVPKAKKSMMHKIFNVLRMSR